MYLFLIAKWRRSCSFAVAACKDVVESQPGVLTEDDYAMVILRRHPGLISYRVLRVGMSADACTCRCCCEGNACGEEGERWVAEEDSSTGATKRLSCGRQSQIEV